MYVNQKHQTQIFQIKSDDLEDVIDSNLIDHNIATKSKSVTSSSSKKTSIFSQDEGEMFGITSLWCLTQENKCRIVIQKMVSSKAFVTIIDIIILVNCVFLVFETVDTLKIISNYSNYVFTSIFTLEFILKVIAYGFIISEHSYLRDCWNWLDLIVVVTGLISFLPGVAANIFALRTFRLIRALKTFSMFPSMKFFITTLLNSLVDVGTAFILLFFFFIIFSSLGLSLWRDKFDYRCRLVDTPVNGSLSIDPTYFYRLCGGVITCGGKKELCLSSMKMYRESHYFLSKISNYDNELDYSAFNFGLTKFDNFLYSLLTIFQVTTCEGWSRVMEMLMDGHNYYVSLVFFILCVIVNYYFMLNLIVALLLYNFSKARERDLQINLNDFYTPIKRKDLKEKKRKNKSITMNIDLSHYNEKEMKKKYQRDYREIDTEKKEKKILVKNFSNFFNQFKKIRIFEPLTPNTPYHREHKFSFYCYYFYKQPIVSFFFYFCILINAVILAMERVNMSNLESKIIEKMNIVLVAIFTLEIIIVLLSDSLKKFVRSFMNDLDFIIVVTSLVEVILKETGKLTTNSSASIASIFRVLRVLRIFKVFRTWSSFQIIMESILETLYSMINFVFLFIIFLFIYTLLGCTCFHGSLRFNGDDYAAKSKSNFYNFDTFQDSLICVFMIIIGDNWYQLFYECYRSDKNNPVIVLIYFITIILFGQITLMNIFLAYLIDSFLTARDKIQKNIQVRDFILDNIFTSSEKNNSLYTDFSHMKNKGGRRHSVEEFNYYLMKLKNQTLLCEGTFEMIGKNRLDFIVNQKVNEEYYSNNPEIYKKNKAKIINLQDLLRKDNREDKIDIEEYEDNELFYEFDIDYEEENMIRMNKIQKTLTMVEMQISLRSKTLAEGYTVSKNLLNKVDYDDDVPVIEDEKSFHIINETKNALPLTEREYIRTEAIESLVDKENKSLKDDSLGIIPKKKRSGKLLTSIKPSPSLEDKYWDEFVRSSSLFMFGKKNRFRLFIRNVVESNIFHYILFVLILLNCIILCLDNPWQDPDGTRMKVIKTINFVLNIMFIIEAIMKIICYGFLFTKGAYLRNVINIIDFFCIIIGLVDLVQGSTNLRYLRTFRAIRSVKPIRLILKSDNLTLMTHSLIKSLPALGNLLISCAAFIFIFALLGITIFKVDLYYYCDISPKYKTEADCISNGGHWAYHYENYSNFLNALKSNFEVMMSEGIFDIMKFASLYKGSKWVMIYFIIYIILGFMFILNLIIAVIIQNFISLREKHRAFAKLTQPENKWVQLQQLMIKFHPVPKIDELTTSKCRKKLAKIVNSFSFDMTITLIIVFSCVTLVIQYNGSPEVYDDILRIINYAFVLIFNIELLLKLIVFGKIYFVNTWNKFDFVIILLSDIVVILSILTHTNVVNLDSISSLPIVLRLLRIFRVFRILNYFPKLRELIDTLVYLLPTVGNMIILLAVVLLIYGNIGMNVFGTIPYRSKITENNNFKNFISSANLLFQVTTGEGWTSIMNELAYHDCRDPLSKKYSEDAYCYKFNTICYDENLINYHNLKTYGYSSCGNNFSYFFFISFIIICPIFLMNLCVVLVIEGFTQSMYENEGYLTQDYLDKFVSVWMDYDPECNLVVRPHEFVLILKQLHPPIGFNYNRHLLTPPLAVEKDYREFLMLKSLVEEKEKNNIQDTSHLIKKLPHSYMFNKYYLSKNKKIHTNDIEVMKLVDKLDIISTTGDYKNKKKTKSYSYTLTKEEGQSEQCYIHFVDACLAMSRFAISKAENISFKKLRQNVVNIYAKKIWLKEYDKDAIQPFFETAENLRETGTNLSSLPNQEVKSNLLSKVLAMRILLKVQKIFKKRLQRARLRISLNRDTIKTYLRKHGRRLSQYKVTPLPIRDDAVFYTKIELLAKTRRRSNSLEPVRYK